MHLYLHVAGPDNRDRQQLRFPHFERGQFSSGYVHDSQKISGSIGIDKSVPLERLLNYRDLHS